MSRSSAFPTDRVSRCRRPDRDHRSAARHCAEAAQRQVERITRIEADWRDRLPLCKRAERGEGSGVCLEPLPCVIGGRKERNHRMRMGDDIVRASPLNRGLRARQQVDPIESGRRALVGVHDRRAVPATHRDAGLRGMCAVTQLPASTRVSGRAARMSYSMIRTSGITTRPATTRPVPRRTAEPAPGRRRVGGENRQRGNQRNGIARQHPGNRAMLANAGMITARARGRSTGASRSRARVRRAPG